MSFPVVLTSPPSSPAPVSPTQWSGMDLFWDAPDGSVWDLTNEAGGVVLSDDGVVGLHNPRVTKHSSTARAVPGKRLRGWRAESRDVFWPLVVWGDGSEEWLARSRAFFSTIHPERAGVWRVRVGGQERTLRLTGVFDDDLPFERDPLVMGWSLFPVALEAAQPFWEGARVRRGPWMAPDPQPFFGEGGGPPFTISSSSAFGSASVPNEGDVEAWGTWTLSGPLSDIRLGVGDALITVPFDLASGDVLVIDTDPRRPTATLNGVNATRLLGMQDYAPVPPGRSVPLHVEATGTGQVMFDLVPLFFRAF